MQKTTYLPLLAVVSFTLSSIICEQVRAQSSQLNSAVPIVAHRGASKDAPENTIAAFMEAWKQGADAIEGDFHLTKDGEIVCVHDANIKHYTGKNLEVRNLTLKELKSYDFGKWHAPTFAGTVIPTLREVLAMIPEGKKIYIEVKSDASLVPIMLEHLKKSGLTPEQIVVISFHTEVIAAVEKARPELKTYWLTSFKKTAEGTHRPSTHHILSTLRKLKTDGVSTHYDGATATRVNDVQKAGFEYHVWTVDQIELAKRLYATGVQSITTNIPGKLRAGISPPPK